MNYNNVFNNKNINEIITHINYEQHKTATPSYSDENKSPQNYINNNINKENLNMDNELTNIKKISQGLIFENDIEELEYLLEQRRILKNFDK